MSLPTLGSPGGGQSESRLCVEVPRKIHYYFIHSNQPGHKECSCCFFPTPVCHPEGRLCHSLGESVLATDILWASLENLTSLSLGSCLKLTIGCQAFTSLSNKLPGSCLRLNKLPCRSPSRSSISISSGWSKIASPISVLSRMLSSLTSLMYSFQLLSQLQKMANIKK